MAQAKVLGLDPAAKRRIEAEAQRKANARADREAAKLRAMARQPSKLQRQARDFVRDQNPFALAFAVDTTDGVNQ